MTLRSVGSSDDDDARSDLADPARRTRDLCAVLMIALGVVGLLTSLYFIHPLAASAVASAVAIAVGVIVGLE